MRYFIAFVLLLGTEGAFAQGNTFQKEISDFQDELNTEYKTAKTSPLEPRDLKKFKQHDFFPADSSYRVTARVVLLKDQEPFKMLTTRGTEKDYIKYADLYFVVKGSEQKLTAYQGLELIKQDAYKDYLFVPFRDPTNGETSYEGGRFMDLRIPPGDSLVLNFNKAYNPYCAYNLTKYACPITPSENTLTIEIPAGVRFKGNH